LSGEGRAKPGSHNFLLSVGGAGRQYAHRVSQRRALGFLFLALAVGLGAVAILSAVEGGRAWVVALAAGVIALWLADLSRRALL
jgi:hypothetical protein